MDGQERTDVTGKSPQSVDPSGHNIAAWQWKVLVVLTSINLLNYFDRLLVVPMFPLLKQDFHLSDFKLGLLASLVLLVACLTAVPAGYWSDRGRRLKIMAGGVFVWSAATFASGLAPSYGALAAARASVGIGEGAYAPGGTAIISASFPAGLRARVQSIFSLGMMVGGVLGTAAGGMLAEKVGWRYSFMLVGLPGVLTGIAILRLRAPVLKPPERGRVAWGLLRIPAFRAVLAGGLFAAFSSAAFINWTPVFIIRYYHLSMAKAAGGLALMVLGSTTTGVLLGGYLADLLQKRWNWGRTALVATGLLVSTPLLYATVQAKSPPAFYAFAFFATATLACYHGPITAIIHDLTPSHAHGFAFGLYLFCVHFFGDTTAPAVVGFLSDRSNLRRALLIGVAANLLSALCFVAAVWLISRQPAPPSSAGVEQITSTAR